MDDLSDNDLPVKQLRFQGSSLKDLKAMPDNVRRSFGHGLWEVQNGFTPTNASPFELSTANEVLKLTERFDSDTYRCVYAVKFEKAVYVLHVFQKKSASGVATPKRDIDMAYSRLERAKADYAAAFPPEMQEPPTSSPPTTKKGKKR